LMSAIVSLKEDHRAIRHVLDILHVITERMELGDPVSPSVLQSILDFMVNFKEITHRGREDIVFLPLLSRREVQRPSAVDLVMAEHEKERRLIQEFQQAVNRYDVDDASSRLKVVQVARKLRTLLDAHVSKEEDILLPWAERLLTPQVDMELIQKIEKIGPSFVRETSAYVDDIARRAWNSYRLLHVQA